MAERSGETPSGGALPEPFDASIIEDARLARACVIIMFLLYSLLLTLGLIVAAPYLLWRRRFRLSGREIAERLGFLPSCLRQPTSGAVWIHAASVGETLAVAKLVAKIREHSPDKRIILSHVTPPGLEAGEKRIPNVAGRFFLPLDWAWAMRRTMETIRPGILIIAETELWPNLLRCARKYGARVALVNARISDRSFGRYRAFRRFFASVLENVDCVCAQTSRDAERFEAIGTKADRLVVMGNLKFDADLARESDFAEAFAAAMEATGRGPTLIAASTMAGEEERVIAAWRDIRTRFSQALLILAPRHPGRFDEAARVVEDEGLVLFRRSQWQSGEEEDAHALQAADVFLLDSIGELAWLLREGDVVFVGGSLVKTGGHNPIEPALWGKAIVFGPHMENFRDVADLFLSRHAALEVASPEGMARAVIELFGDEAKRAALGERAKTLVAEQSGATERTLDQLKPWLDAPIPAATRR